MNAIRSFPLINKHSRPATPASGTGLAVSGAATMQPIGSAHVDVRPRSSIVVTPTPTLPGPRAHSAVPLSGGKRTGTSPPLSRAQTPQTATTPLPADISVPQTPAMDAIGLRLNDVANKALSGVDFKTKKGMLKGSGWTVGESVAAAFTTAPLSDTYLLRAILRTVVRSLSIYLSRLEALLLPAFSDPQFAASPNLTPAPHQTHLNATQAFAVTIAHAAWGTCEKLEQVLETANYPRFVEDTLRPTMDKFDLIVGKVVRPLLNAVKFELETSLSRTDGVAPKAPTGPVTVPAPSSAALPPIQRERSNPGSQRTASANGTTRTLAVPHCLQQFASRVDGARKVFEIVAAPCSHDGEGWITKIAVSVMWRGMRVISESDTGMTGNLQRTPSPGTVTRALNGVKEGSPPTVSAKITSLSILPSRSVSRPASPPRGQLYDKTTHSLMSFEGLVKRLVGGLVQPPTAAATAVDSDDQEAQYIAREALHEALEAIESASIASAAAYSETGAATRILESVRRLRDDIDNDDDEKLDDALEDLPSVLLFYLIARRTNMALTAIPYVSEKAPLRVRDPWELLGWSKADFDRQVLSGFGPAEEWGPRVARAFSPELERVMGELCILGAGEAPKVSLETQDAMEWVRAFGVALDARTGVKVAGIV